MRKQGHREIDTERDRERQSRDDGVHHNTYNEHVIDDPIASRCQRIGLFGTQVSQVQTSGENVILRLTHVHPESLHTTHTVRDNVTQTHTHAHTRSTTVY